jgi:dynamin 1-like protein
MNQINSSAKFIAIANEINKLFSEHEIYDKICMPRIVVVGAQSTGKSSLLNKIMNINILPMGKSMITKTPIHINMHKHSQLKIEIGYYNNNKWEIVNNMVFDELTDEHSETIRNKIQTLSDKITENKPIVVNKPIVINLYSPNITELSLIDLPGLITLAREDQGQSVSIVSDIQNLVTHYIKQPKTIILTLVQAKQDLETDLGLAIVKNTIREAKEIFTVGVLTKPDLVDIDIHMGDFLLGKMSTSLHMDYGYYIVNCKENEKSYFANHKIYNKPEYRNKCGIENLTNEISQILVNSIKRALPQVATEINKLEYDTTLKLTQMGSELLNNDDQKSNYITSVIKNYCNNMEKCVESKGYEPNMGHNLNIVMNNFRKKVDDSNIFDPEMLSNEAIRQIHNSFKGYHTKIKATPLEIIERVIKKEPKPLSIFRTQIQRFSELVIQSIIDGADILLNNTKVKFPKFNLKMYQLTEEFLNKLKINFLEMSNHFINSQEEYIWTDDIKFNNMLSSFDIIDKLKVEFDIYETHHEYESYETKIRKLLKLYLETIKKDIKNNIPKLLTSMIIKEVTKKLHSYLIFELNKKDSFVLLDFDPEYKTEMDKLNKVLTSIKTAKSIINI